MFTARDGIWLSVLIVAMAALALGWFVDHKRLRDGWYHAECRRIFVEAKLEDLGWIVLSKGSEITIERADRWTSPPQPPKPRIRSKDTQP
jgi:hypothetical protein